MAVETDGTVKMRGDVGPGVGVKVLAVDGRLKLLSGNELVGDWKVSELGISALNEGFAIRAEGEEFVLKAIDDANLAEELGIVAVSPRLGRKVAALHNPQDPDPPQVVEEPRSHVSAIAFALGGVLVLLGGSFLRTAPASPAALQGVTDQTSGSGGGEFWIAFLVAGVLMVAVAYVMSLGTKWVRGVALLVVAVVIGLFGLVVSQAASDSSHLTAYGFIAGGLVVGVAVLFGGGIRSSD